MISIIKNSKRHICLICATMLLFVVSGCSNTGLKISNGSTVDDNSSQNIKVSSAVSGDTHQNLKEDSMVDDKKRDLQRGNTTFNLNNGGIFAQEGDWVYFAGDIINNGNGLYKMKVDGSQKSKISDDAPKNINVVGGWIYYLVEEGGNVANTKLYKIYQDGTGREKIIGDNCSAVKIVNGWIYYIDNSDNSHLYRMKIDGTDKKMIFDKPFTDYDISGDWIYINVLTDVFNKIDLDRIKTDGTNETTILNDSSYGLCIFDDWLYFLNNNDDKIYRVRTDGTGKEKFIDNKVEFNVNSGWVYYIDYISSNIYKMMIDGTGKTKLNNIKSENLHILGDWVYYDVDNSQQDGQKVSPGVSYYVHHRMKTDGTEDTSF